jgi:ubiquinone/menaquinone biosynthesis C-methylase UbiE
MVATSSQSDQRTSAVDIRARSFGQNAVEYADYRPGYPLNAVSWGLSSVRDPDPYIVDLGAGTGKLTQALFTLNVRTVAVEPDAAMCAEMRRRIPGVDVVGGTAESIPLPDHCADGVFVGQALHWFDYVPAMNEIARVLKPGGVVVALWNQNDRSVDWVSAFSNLANSTPLAKKWFEQYSALPEHDYFEPSETRSFRHSRRHTADTLLEAAFTESHILVSPADRRTALRQELSAFLASQLETSVGEFDLPLVTTVVRASLRPRV